MQDPLNEDVPDTPSNVPQDQARVTRSCGRVTALLHALTIHDPTLTITHLNSLLMVALNPGLTITDLARVGRITLATASRHVARLGSPDGLGLLTIDISQDARIKPLRLTRKGLKVIRAAVGELRREDL